MTTTKTHARRKAPAKVAKNIIAVEAGVPCGAIYTWTGTGDNATATLRPPLADLLPEDQLPTPPTPAVGLARAVKRLAGALGLEEERVKGEGAWALLRREVVDGKILKREECRIGLDDANKPVVVSGTDLAAELKDCFDVAMQTTTAADMGEWLSDFFRGIDGQLIRPSGGFWFVLEAKDELARKVVAAIESTGGATVYRIPAMRSADAARAVMSALRDEVAKGAEEVNAWVEEQRKAIEDGTVEAVRDSSKAIRELRIATIEDKVKLYAAALKVDVTDVQDKLDALRYKVQELKVVAKATANGQLTSEGGRALLDLEDKKKVDTSRFTGTAAELKEALDAAKELQPTVRILDLN